MATIDKLREAHDRMISAVQTIVSGDDWRAMLDVARRFNQYSPNNLYLILAQRPDATKVCGFNAWKSLGRFVRKGEKGIAILAPCVYRNNTEAASDDEAVERRLAGFKVVHVFDITQTDGKEIPEVSTTLLDGDAPEALWEALAEQIAKAGYTLSRGRLLDGVYGATRPHDKTVVVRDDISPAAATKTLCHELAHVLLHAELSPSGCRDRIEIEAESVAYLVSSSLGMDTTHYSFPYVARWANGDVDLIRQTVETVVTTARSILDKSGLLAELDGETERRLVTTYHQRGPLQAAAG